MVTGWLPTGKDCEKTGAASKARTTAVNLSMFASMNRLVVELAGRDGHDALPRPFLQVRSALQVDRLAFLEYSMDGGLVLQDADVRERVAIDDQHVGPLARLERPHVWGVDGECRVLPSAGDRLERAHA